MIQSLVRQKRTRRAFAMLRALAKSVRIVSKAMRFWQFRRHRKAALCVQAHLRAYVCESRGICRHGTILAIIYGTRASLGRSMRRL